MMENMQQPLSMWFYLGIFGLILGIALIYVARGNTKSKWMENGYFILILGLIGIISERYDFAAVLFILTVVSGLLILFDKLVLHRVRIPNVSKPHYIHYAREFFPVILVVFILRSFLFEAYQIPSSSMRPSLIVGDFILVNKYTYGIREPISNKVLIPIHQIVRGDVIVFKDPLVKNRDLIKRVVGIGGDKIEYVNKHLIINDQPINYTADGNYTYTENIPTQGNIVIATQQFIENLTGVQHQIITWNKLPTLFINEVQTFDDSQNCKYDGDDGFSCIVPAGEYFMMGDNRDDSFDSRYWGFVQNQAILGKAVLVWFNFHNLSRIGTHI